MFLKSIKLRGFKTFADLTEIAFGAETKITAVVGPNGCGKSNLMDAMRWVLGEDNPRELRVAALSGIIFAGTAQRKPLSLAEITLTFDNASGILPTPFTEVGLRRRTFREGESEFFINKDLCRLKDIKNLLLDTGLGEGSYSIITQGQVDVVLSSRGEDRRAFFEEAAGIAKYKYRKMSAERKLIAAEQNILRINDLKVEVGEQLITLEEQARKATEYKELQKKVRELDLGLSKRRLQNLLEKKKELAEQLEKIKAEGRAQRETEAKGEEKISALRKNLETTENDIERLLSQIEREKDILRDVELERRFKIGELERNKRELESLQAKKEGFAQKIGSIQSRQSPAANHELFEFEQELSEFFSYIEKLGNLITDILSFFGRKQSIRIISEGEEGEKDKLMLELLQEELKRAEEETQRLNFSLQASQSELEVIVPDGAKKDQLLAQLTQLRKKKEELISEMRALEEKVRSEEKVERNVRDEEVSLEIALAKVEGEITGIAEKISLEYSLDLENLLSLATSATNIPRSRSELEEGKSRLRELEPVNLLAIEEHERCKERFSFIEAQLKDLNEARENLRSLILELDAKAKETFVGTMQAISTTFSEIFSKLFSGGEAKIFLTNPTSPLESEVEISVKPFGRKWLPLTLLSGGERALSAIAILFSLLKIRPSPFCFLDEVDAALDDANVKRFASMLQDFCSKIQMIVITHNKQTMAVADTIYGITMEEPGVSKVISMRLAEVAS